MPYGFSLLSHFVISCHYIEAASHRAHLTFCPPSWHLSLYHSTPAPTQLEPRPINYNVRVNINVRVSLLELSAGTNLGDSL